MLFRLNTHLAFVFVLMLATPVFADAIKMIVVQPRKQPRVIEVYVTVEPHSDNRGYDVFVVCDRHGEGSFRQLDGLASKGPFPPVVFRNLPECLYTISAQLLGPGGQIRANAESRRARVGTGSSIEDDLVGESGLGYSVQPISQFSD